MRLPLMMEVVGMWNHGVWAVEKFVVWCVLSVNCGVGVFEAVGRADKVVERRFAKERGPLTRHSMELNFCVQNHCSLWAQWCKSMGKPLLLQLFHQMAWINVCEHPARRKHMWIDPKPTRFCTCFVRLGIWSWDLQAIFALSSIIFLKIIDKHLDIGGDNSQQQLLSELERFL